MKAIGVVTKTENGLATVTSQRSSACASCHDCEAKGACHAELIFGSQNSYVEVVAKNSIGAKCGDKVELESSTKSTLLASFFVFVIPFILTLAVYYLFSDLFLNSMYFPLVLILVFLLVFFVSVKLVDRIFKKKHSIYVVGIIEESRESFEAE